MRGIPVDISSEWKMPGVELVLTNLHAAESSGQGAYKYSAVSTASARNARTHFPSGSKVEVSRDGRFTTWPSSAAKPLRTQCHRRSQKQKDHRHADHVFSGPDHFHDHDEFKFERLATRLRELAFLNPGLETTLEDERAEPPKEGNIFYKHGIEEFVKQLGENKQVIHPKPV